jgi:hypothetical protein
MKLLAFIFLTLALITTPFAIIQMLKPSVFPLASVLGSSVIPGLLYWWAYICFKKYKSKKAIEEDV